MLQKTAQFKRLLNQSEGVKEAANEEEVSGLKPCRVKGGCCIMCSFCPTTKTHKSFKTGESLVSFELVHRSIIIVNLYGSFAARPALLEVLYQFVMLVHGRPSVIVNFQA